MSTITMSCQSKAPLEGKARRTVLSMGQYPVNITAAAAVPAVLDVYIST